MNSINLYNSHQRYKQSNLRKYDKPTYKNSQAITPMNVYITFSFANKEKRNFSRRLFVGMMVKFKVLMRTYLNVPIDLLSAQTGLTVLV